MTLGDGISADEKCESSEQLTKAIKAFGKTQGFHHVQTAAAVSPTGFHPLLKWLSNGYQADMEWIDRRREAYQHPSGVLPQCRSIVVVTLNYHNDSPPPTDFRIARYAWGTTDYHSVLRKKLKQLVKLIRHHRPQSFSRAVVDTAPLLERDFARIAGIGWFGKNTMLISRDIGSYFFIGAVLTTETISYDEEFHGEYCGTCTKCLDACPTDAFPEPGVLDANRCISYLTIERRDKAISEDLQPGMGDWIFGCDICQEVCPWNRFAPQSSLAEFHCRPEVAALSLSQLASISEEDFTSLFKGTPLERTGHANIVRNAKIALSNARNS